MLNDFGEAAADLGDFFDALGDLAGEVAHAGDDVDAPVVFDDAAALASEGALGGGEFFAFDGPAGLMWKVASAWK